MLEGRHLLVWMDSLHPVNSIPPPMLPGQQIGTPCFWGFSSGDVFFDRLIVIINGESLIANYCDVFDMIGAWKIEVSIAFGCSLSALVMGAVTLEGEGGVDTEESHKAPG